MDGFVTSDILKNKWNAYFLWVWHQIKCMFIVLFLMRRDNWKMFPLLLFFFLWEVGGVDFQIACVWICVSLFKNLIKI